MKKIASLALGLMVASTSYATVIFEEDFEQYASSVGTGDRSALEADGWEFVVTNGADENPFTAVTVEFNIEVGPNGLNPAWENGNRNGLGPVDLNGNQTEGIFMWSDHDAYGGEWTNPITGETIAAVDQNLDIGSGQSYDVYTPRFDASNLSEVWFHMDTSIVLNNNGSPLYVVDIQVGDGEWQNVAFRAAPARFPSEEFGGVTITENFTTPDYDFPTEGILGKDGNQGGLHGQVHYDLTEFAAGQSDVRLRIRHYEPDWEWWIAFDNVVVDDVPPPQGSDVIFGPEEFTASEEFAQDGIPETWTISQNILEADNGWGHTWTNPIDIDALVWGDPLAGRWKDGDGLNRLAGQGYAIYQSLPDLSVPIAEDGTVPEGAFATLDSPVIDCSNYEEVFFYAWSEFNPGNRNALKFFIQYSIDGGQTFSNLFDFNQGLLETGEGSRAQEHFIPIPDAGGEDDLVIRFLGQGADGERYFAVDDVTITGNEVGTAVESWNLF